MKAIFTECITRIKVAVPEIKRKHEWVVCKKEGSLAEIKGRFTRLSIFDRDVASAGA